MAHSVGVVTTWHLLSEEGKAVQHAKGLVPDLGVVEASFRRISFLPLPPTPHLLLSLLPSRKQREAGSQGTGGSGLRKALSAVGVRLGREGGRSRRSGGLGEETLEEHAGRR